MLEFMILGMARYDALRKAERNQQLREYWKAHPDLSYKEIGEAFGITQSRAWRICHSNHKEQPSEK